MGGLLYYIWQSGDTIWKVCGNVAIFSASGYLDVPTFVLAVQSYNSSIVDWQAVPAQTRIVLPLLAG